MCIYGRKLPKGSVFVLWFCLFLKEHFVERKISNQQVQYNVGILECALLILLKVFFAGMRTTTNRRECCKLNKLRIVLFIFPAATSHQLATLRTPFVPPLSAKCTFLSSRHFAALFGSLKVRRRLF